MNLFVILFGVVFSSLSLAESVTEANQFDCVGKVYVKDHVTGKSENVDLTVGYESTSHLGTPLLQVTVGKQEFDWTKKDSIKALPSPLGTLVTGTDNSKVRVGGNPVHYTLVVPRVILGKGAAQLEFNTKLVVTNEVRKLPETGAAAAGPLQANSFHEVVCTAKLVEPLRH